MNGKLAELSGRVAAARMCPVRLAFPIFVAVGDHARKLLLGPDRRRGWDANCNYASPSGLTSGRDASAVGGHDSISNRQAESGAVTACLGGKEGIEDAVDVFGWYAPASIGNCHLDKIIGTAMTGLDGDGASFVYRLNRVHQEVDEYLLELRGVSDHRR